MRNNSDRGGKLLSQPRSLIALIALATVLTSLSPGVLAQTYTVVLSVNDSRPLGQAVLSLIRSYPVTITYEDPRYEYAGDLRDVTRQVSKSGRADVRAIVPRGGALRASYDVAQDTGEPVDMARAIQTLVAANNLARRGGRFQVVRSSDAFHVVPTEARDSNGRWMPQQSVLDTPITFSSGGARDGFELIPSILQQVSVQSGEKIVSALNAARACSIVGCVQDERIVEATNEPARDVLMRLVSSLSLRYTWVLYFDPSERQYVFNLVLGVERSGPSTAPDRQTPKPSNPTPGVPANLASVSRSGAG